MLNTSTIPARKLQTSYKTIIEQVKARKNVVVLTTNDKPQAAIVSLEDLEKLQRVKTTQAAFDMIQMAAEYKEELKSLPADLRERADDMLYTK